MKAPEAGSYEHRFSGLARLYGKTAHLKIKESHICVVGVGGVGSWVAEAIARSGVNKITLVDWDDLCYTNINRQIHALDGTIGKSKTDTMKERILAINPYCEVYAIREFFTEETASDIFSQNFDGVIDAIDQVSPKCHLIASCKKLKIPLVSIGAAGGTTDPTLIKIDDLNRTYQDPLIAKVRKVLKTKYNFPKSAKERFRIPCVFSSEHKIIPDLNELECDTSTQQGPKNLGCDYGYGSATFITGSFAFFAVSKIFQLILKRS